MASLEKAGKYCQVLAQDWSFLNWIAKVRREVPHFYRSLSSICSSNYSTPSPPLEIGYGSTCRHNEMCGLFVLLKCIHELEDLDDCAIQQEMEAGLCLGALYLLYR